MKILDISLIILLGACSVLCAEDYYKKWEAAQKSGICHLHNKQMKKVSVLIAYGLPMRTDYTDKSEKAEEASFPHAKDYVLRGCTGSPQMEKKELIYECSICRSNKTEWIKNNPYPK